MAATRLQGDGIQGRDGGFTGSLFFPDFLVVLIRFDAEISTDRSNIDVAYSYGKKYIGIFYQIALCISRFVSFYILKLF